VLLLLSLLVESHRSFSGGGAWLSSPDVGGVVSPASASVA